MLIKDKFDFPYSIFNNKIDERTRSFIEHGVFQGNDDHSSKDSNEMTSITPQIQATCPHVQQRTLTKLVYVFS